MAERAHPDDSAFQDRWAVTWRWKGRIPWPRYERSPWKQGLEDRYQFCLPYVRGKRVIDVPCGTGWGTAMLAGARSIVGIDVSLEAVTFARKRFGGKAMFVVGCMDRIPLGEAECEVVICLEGIEHVPEEVGAAFVGEAARVLAPGGEIIVTSPLPDPQRAPNPYHVHEYTAEELTRLMSSRFESIRSVVQDVEGIPTVYYVGRRREGAAT